jgi:hypothetical protein
MGLGIAAVEAILTSPEPGFGLAAIGLAAIGLAAIGLAVIRRRTKGSTTGSLPRPLLRLRPGFVVWPV